VEGIQDRDRMVNTIEYPAIQLSSQQYYDDQAVRTLSGSTVSCSAIEAVKDQLDTGATFLFTPLDDETEDSMVELPSNSLS